MILSRLKAVYDQNQNKNSLLLRNLLKEQLQYFLLNFIYNSSYADNFLFKGGTCLRFCFDLPRLSEDLDFDVKSFKDFSHQQFTKEIISYFAGKLQYKELKVKVSGQNKIIYLQFPVLAKIGFAISSEESAKNILFVRIDLAEVAGKFYKEEITLKSTPDFSFIIRRYSLADLFTGKIAAILKREAFEADQLQPRFKGRDYFDLFWFFQKKASINYPYLSSLTGISDKEELKTALKKKIQEAQKKKGDLQRDLSPFLEDENFIADFINHLAKMRIEV